MSQPKDSSNGRKPGTKRAPTSVKAKRMPAGAKRAAGASGTTKRGTTRREEIVRAAAETFYRKGYDATTTQDIAEAVGMLKGSLYYYISAKEDLLYEIISEVHEVWANNLKRHEIMDGEPLTRIWAFVHNNVVGNAENLVNSAVFFRDFSALTGQRRKHILALRDVHDNTLREMIREGQTMGQVRASVDPKVAATGILTMCNALYHWYRPDGALSVDDVAVQYADLVVSGLATQTKMLDRARHEALTQLEAAASA
ncbi:MAG: TetR/AcrR family transcriptional regulator [Ilumatobacteraceae bacterium]